MSRSLKKGPYVDEKLYRKVEKQVETGKREPIKTWARRCTVVPEFVGTTFKVHNGRNFVEVYITDRPEAGSTRVILISTSKPTHRSPLKGKGRRSPISP